MPYWALLTEGDVTNVRVAQMLTVAPGMIVVVGRGYLDDALSQRWMVTDEGFVVRPRTNMRYDVLERRPVPTRGPVVSDEVIRLSSSHAAARCTVLLRQVTIGGEPQQRQLASLTNLMHLVARTIAAPSKERWPIGLRFTALKQPLPIMTGVGTRENARCRCRSGLP